MIEPSFKKDTESYLVNLSGNKRQATTFIDNMKLPVHRWYRYSAGYSANWAKSLMKHWQGVNIIDPFGGSGTTILAAQEDERNAIGIEIHPTVSRIANAKLLWDLDVYKIRKIVDEIIDNSLECGPVELPENSLIDKCFPDKINLSKLVSLRNVINNDFSGGERELLWLMLVSIIRSCSPVGTAQWQYVLPNKAKKRALDPIDAFRNAADIFIEDMLYRQLTVDASKTTAIIYNEDARSLDSVPDGWADVVITSPPYANNYDYADALRLEQTFLGEIDGWSDLRPLRNILLRSATQNIGKWKVDEALESSLLDPIRAEIYDVYKRLEIERKNHGGNKPYSVMIAGYFYDNAKVFSALRKKTKEKVRVCYVVGDSAPYGIHVPVEEWLGRIAVHVGFKSWSFMKVRDRNTKWKNRKHDHPLHEGYLWIEG